MFEPFLIFFAQIGQRQEMYPGQVASQSQGTHHLLTHTQGLFSL